MNSEKPTVTISVIAVYGTFSGDFDVSGKCQDTSHWWHTISKWWTYLTSVGEPDYLLVPFRDDDFVWTGALDGLSIRAVWERIRGKQVTTQHRQWFAGGEALHDYIGEGIYQGQSADHFIVVAHSHGGQVALYCAASGRAIPILITMSTPHRLDMQIVTEKAKLRIGYWVHCYDPDGDRIGQEGAFGDGKISFDRRQPLANINVELKGCSHSGALRDPALYHVWKDTIMPLIKDRIVPRQVELVPVPPRQNE